MASGYVFAVSCAWCGGDLRPVVESRATGAETVAVACCDGCSKEWVVVVQLRWLPKAESARRQRTREKARVA